ncbi:MAG: hypothetical protein JKY42_11325 [Flavobacteriales bacterium]|nr:hypothetical protein [Flavobacteriales bacterium]
MKTFKNILIAILLLTAGNSLAQCDTIASICDSHISDGFISDGQVYRALLIEDQIAEFHTTFYGDTKYRIAGCSGITDGNLLFRVFDEERNLIFTNEEYLNAPHWDFVVKSTLNCVIEAQLGPTSLSSGCAVLLIGFKQ